MIAATVVLVASLTADAGSIDTYGFGAASIGRGMGGVSVADGSMTVFRNPALLQKLEWAEASVGFAFQRGAFPQSPPVYWDTNRDGSINANDEPLEMPGGGQQTDGLTLSIGRHVGPKAGIALNAFLPTDQFLRLRTTEPALPAWVMYGNRSQRFELGVGFGVELYKGLSLGVGTELIAQAKYRINGTLDVAAGAVQNESDTAQDLIEYVRVDVHEMTLDLIPRFVPVAGFHWDVGTLFSELDGLNLGVAWRGSSGIPVSADIDLQLNGSLNQLGDLGDLGLSIVMPVELSIYDHYVPERWSFGASYEREGWPLIYIDLHRTLWSGMKVNVAQVTESAIMSQVFQVEENLVEDENQYSVAFSDKWSFNTGTEVTLPALKTKGKAGDVVPILRAGFGYFPSPLVEQGRGSSFVDSDRMMFATGLGIRHLDPFGLVPGPVGWDIFYTRHALAEGSLTPEPSEHTMAGIPVDDASIPIGGSLWSFGFQFSVSF